VNTPTLEREHAGLGGASYCVIRGPVVTLHRGWFQPVAIACSEAGGCLLRMILAIAFFVGGISWAIQGSIARDVRSLVWLRR
jgi:hypothetical protein